MESDLQAVPVSLGEGKPTILVEAHVPAGGEVEVGAFSHAFATVTEALGDVSSQLVDALKKAAPDEATLELGFDFAVQNGILVTALVKGTGSASVKVTMTWKRG